MIHLHNQNNLQAATYARQGRQLVRLTPSIGKTALGAGIAKQRRTSSTRQRPALVQMRRVPPKAPQQCLLYSRCPFFPLHGQPVCQWQDAAPGQDTDLFISISYLKTWIMPCFTCCWFCHILANLQIVTRRQLQMLEGMLVDSMF